MLFFRTVFSLFRGVSGFPELMTRNPFRALLHFVLFCILLAILVASCRVWTFSSHGKYLTEKLGSYFGGISVTEKGVYPLKNAEAPVSFVLTPVLRLNYVTADSVSGIEKMTGWEQVMQMFWTPRGFVMAIRLTDDRDQYMLFPLPIPGANMFQLTPLDFAAYTRFSAKGTADYLKKVYFPKAKEKYPVITAETIPPKAVYDFVVSAAAGALALSAFFSLFLLALVTVLLFSLFQMIWKHTGYEKLKYRNIFVIMIYSAFPALTGAALFLAFSIHFISFQTVFFIVFFIYHLLAFRAVARYLNPPDPRNEHFDDQDFY